MTLTNFRVNTYAKGGRGVQGGAIESELKRVCSEGRRCQRDHGRQERWKLVLFAEGLGVGFAVGVEEVFAALLPGGF